MDLLLKALGVIVWLLVAAVLVGIVLDIKAMMRRQRRDRGYAPDRPLVPISSTGIAAHLHVIGRTSSGMTFNPPGFAPGFEEHSPEQRRELFRFLRRFGVEQRATWRLPAEVSAVRARWDQRRMERATAPALGATRHQGRL